MGDPLALDQLEQPLGVEPRHQVDAGPGAEAEDRVGVWRRVVDRADDRGDDPLGSSNTVKPKITASDAVIRSISSSVYGGRLTPFGWPVVPDV